MVCSVGFSVVLWVVVVVFMMMGYVGVGLSVCSNGSIVVLGIRFCI